MKAVAYIDEAGAKGFARNLTSDRDDAIGLMCAVVFPCDLAGEVREAYRPGYDRFCGAAPAGEKHHFTDAFKVGNEAWASVAHDVRDEFCNILASQAHSIVYDARRLSLQRQDHERGENLLAAAKAARRNQSISVPSRPSLRRVETNLIEGLILKLDAFGQDKSLDLIDLRFDEIDDEIADHYREILMRLRSMKATSSQVKGWDKTAKAQVMGAVTTRITTSFEIDVTKIGGIEVIGKDDPLILLADMIANSLYRHLAALPILGPLNAPASISNWILAGSVYGVRDDAFEDLF